MIVAILRKFVLLIPFMYILPHVFTSDQTMAVFLAEPVADFVAVLCTSVIFFFEFRKALSSLKAVKE